MNRQIPIIGLVLSLCLAYILIWVTFSNVKVFWYFYTFTILFLMSISFFYAKIKDEINTLQYIITGLFFGILLYVIIAMGYMLIDTVSNSTTTRIHKFSSKFAPSAIWHYLLLLFIIAPGEELFWRGFIQQQLKRWFSPLYAVIISALLFGLSFVVSGFWPGVLVAFIIGLILGLLYEWKKSMPLIILSHLTMLVLLFLIHPIL